MNDQANNALEISSINAKLTFFVDNGEPPINYITEDRVLERTGEYKEHDLLLRDAREVKDALLLDKQGFQLISHNTKVKSFYNEDEVSNIYNSEVESLIKGITKAKSVVVFDHTVRVEDHNLRSEKKVREPVMFVHNDYTQDSGRQRVRDLFPREEAEDLLTRRFNIINIWRSIEGIVQTTPLAFCDADSINPGQLITAERRTKERVGYTQAMTFNEKNSWYYVSDMKPNEAVLLKTFESDELNFGGPSGHTAFKNSNAPSNADARQSIETRVFAFY